MNNTPMKNAPGTSGQKSKPGATINPSRGDKPASSHPQSGPAKDSPGGTIKDPVTSPVKDADSASKAFIKDGGKAVHPGQKKS